MGDRDGDDLLYLRRQRSVGKHLLREGAKSLFGFRRELLPLVGELMARKRVDMVVHATNLRFAYVDARRRGATPI